MLVRYGNYTHVQTLMKLFTFLSMIQTLFGMTFRVYSHFSNFRNSKLLLNRIVLL